MQKIVLFLILCMLPKVCFSGISLDIAIENDTSQELWFQNSIDGFPISLLPKTINIDRFLRENEDKQHFATQINKIPINIALYRQTESTIKLILCHDKNNDHDIYFLTGNTNITCSLTINNQAEWKLYLTEEQKQSCSISWQNHKIASNKF